MLARIKRFLISCVPFGNFIDSIPPPSQQEEFKKKWHDPNCICTPILPKEKMSYEEKFRYEEYYSIVETFEGLFKVYYKLYFPNLEYYHWAQKETCISIEYSFEKAKDILKRHKEFNRGKVREIDIEMGEYKCIHDFDYDGLVEDVVFCKKCCFAMDRKKVE